MTEVELGRLLAGITAEGDPSIRLAQGVGRCAARRAPACRERTGDAGWVEVAAAPITYALECAACRTHRIKAAQDAEAAAYAAALAQATTWEAALAVRLRHDPEALATAPGVYLLQEAGERLTKIGHTGSLQTRLYDLSRAAPTHTLLSVLPCPSAAAARELERTLHKTFRAHCRFGEFFALDAAALADIHAAHPRLPETSRSFARLAGLFGVGRAPQPAVAVPRAFSLIPRPEDIPGVRGPGHTPRET